MREGDTRSPLMAAFAQSPRPQLVCNRDGAIQAANSALAAWLDCDLKTLTNWHIDQFLPSLTPHRLSQIDGAGTLLTTAVSAGRDWRVQVDIQHYKEADGQVGYWVQCKSVEEEGLMQHRLSALFESSMDGIAFAGVDGTFQLANHAFLDMLGRSAEEVIGHNFRDFTPEEYLEEENQRYIDQVLEDGVSEVYEKHYIRKDGTLLPISIRLALVRDAEGNPEGCWSICRDSSLRNQLIESLTSSERRFRALFRNSLDAIAFWTVDHDLRYANRAYLDMIGYTREELADMSYHDLTPEGWEEVDHEITRQVEERGYSEVFEKELRHRDGRIVPVSVRASAFRDHQGKIIGSWVIFRDITHYKTALNQLQHSQNLLQQTSRMARVGGWEFDTTHQRFSFTDETYRILAIPRAFNTSLTSIKKLFDDDSGRQLVREVTNTLYSGQPMDMEVTLDGFEPERWLRISAQVAVDSRGRNYVVGAVQDISEFKARQRSLEIDRDNFQQMAFHDPLTGLPNRLLLEDRFRQLMFSADRANCFIAVFVIDLDDFKEINDQSGHPAGDALLKAIAQRLRSTVRQSDTVARLGGDEFIVLAALESAQEAGIVAEKLFRELQTPIDWEGVQLQSHCSMGVAVYPEQGADFDSLYEAADKAMYQAKASGKNQFQSFNKNV